MRGLDIIAGTVNSRSLLKATRYINMESQVKYLLSLRSIRERAKIVGDAAKSGKLSHFDLHEDRLDEVADFVTSVIKVRG